MLNRQLIEDGIIVLIILIFLNFFSYTKIADSALLTVSGVYGTGIVLMIITYFNLVFKSHAKIGLDRIILLFTFGMLVSAFMANLLWDQPFMSSLKVYGPFLVYFLYFLLVFLDISVARIERIITLLFFISLIVFLIDYKTFPNPLFSWRSEERRNGITIFFNGQGFTFLGAFFFLNKFLNEKKIIYLLWFCLGAFCLFGFTQSRMNLLGVVLGFFLLLFFSSIKGKYIIIALLILAGGVFYSKSSAFSGIKEDSNDQAQFYKEDVRVLAHTFFIYELQKGVPTVLFGNGVPSIESKLGLEGLRGIDKGFWTSDVGLTGIFSYFGLLGVIVWLLFFYQVFKMKNKSRSIYLKAYFLMLLITALAGFAIFDQGYMSATIITLYLVRCEKIRDHETEDDILAEENTELLPDL